MTTASLVRLGILVGILILLWLAKFIFRYLLKKGLVAVGAKALAQQPDQIHLASIESGSWRKVPAASALAEPLLSNGFVEAGSFVIREMPGLKVHFLLNPAELIYAAVYEHPQVPCWIDYVCRYQDGNGITFTTNQRGAGFEQRPGNPIIHAPEMDGVSLLQRCRAERPKENLVAFNAEQIGPFFEKAYAETIAWRKNKGLSAKEVMSAALEKNAEPAAATAAPAVAAPSAPPTLYIARNGQQEGPLTEEQVRSEIAAGRLTMADLGWREGMADWAPLSTILR
jgi:hypothetical protein